MLHSLFNLGFVWPPHVSALPTIACGHSTLPNCVAFSVFSQTLTIYCPFVFRSHSLRRISSLSGFQSCPFHPNSQMARRISDVIASIRTPCTHPHQGMHARSATVPVSLPLSHARVASSTAHTAQCSRPGRSERQQADLSIIYLVSSASHIKILALPLFMSSSSSTSSLFLFLSCMLSSLHHACEFLDICLVSMCSTTACHPHLFVSVLLFVILVFIMLYCLLF